MKRLQFRKRSPLTMAITLGVVAVAVAPLLFFGSVFILFAGNPLDKDPFNDMTFNRSAWLEDATNCDGGNRRGHMSEDMIAHYLKPGMTKLEVRTLLGRYDDGVRHIRPCVQASPIYFTTMTAQQLAYVDESYIYYIGEEQGYYIDRAWLNVFFQRGRYLGATIGFPTYESQASARPR